MAGSQRNQRQHVDLPRNWRLISAAGLTAFGLACGVGHPAMGDWWALPKVRSSSNAAAPKSAGSKATAARSRETKPSATENGFSATIRRLQADAQHQAEQGDLDRAVQLAERAAKISEASSQLNGSAKDCSPEQTALFANDLRSRRDAIAGRGHRGEAEPRMAAAAPRSSTTISPKSGAERGSEVSRSEEKLVESARDHLQPTNRPTNSNEQDLAWAGDLPPTPAPEAEPFQTPTKFRRIVLNRTAIESDEPDVKSHILPDERLVVSQSRDVIDDPFDLEDDLEQSPIAVVATRTNEAPANRRAARPETSAPVEESLREPFRDQIQHVADKELDDESSPFNRKLEWEHEDLNTEPVLSAKPTVSSVNPTVKPTASVVQRSADLTEKRADTKSKESEAVNSADESFPVQRVVQLRRRLESAASLNPGGAFKLPAQAEAAPSANASSQRHLAPTEPSETKTSTTIPASRDGSIVSTRRSRSSLEVAPPAVATPEQAPRPERHLVKLREHRLQSESVQHASTNALPPAQSSRRHSVGFSEPILWQSVEERGPVVPTLSLISDIRNRDDGTRLASATSSSDKLNGSILIPASRSETPHFGTIELPSGDSQATGTGASVLFASSHSTRPSSTVDGPALSETNGLASTAIDKSSSTVRNKNTSASKASHRVSRHSFALIEPLAASLTLPVATTASLLGCAGLALFGFGLILLRAAFRWRHVG